MYHKKQLGAYCPNAYTVIRGMIEIAFHEARETEKNRISVGILPINSPFYLLITNLIVIKFGDSLQINASNN